MRQAILTLDNVTKAFGSYKAVDSFNLDVYEGETVALLGPSGCGKSTTLRMVAGLERPTGGSIVFQGKSVVSVVNNLFLPPEKRNMGMVFQSYALWPHKTVYENIAYPLKLRRVKPSEIKERVYQSIELVGLKGLEHRPVPLLSGGQQQRVALARALVYEPSLLLLDEPFSNLDTKLRTQLRVELKQLQKKINLTTLFVTHDQVEALSIADRVVIMNQGGIEQIDTPSNIYEAPKTRFVRDFLGKVVTLSCRVEQIKGPDKLELRLMEHHPTSTTIVIACPNPTRFQIGEQVELSVRPEDIKPWTEGSFMEPNHQIQGEISTLLFIGSCYESEIRIGNETIFLEIPRDQEWAEGKAIFLQIPESAVSLWPVDRKVGSLNMEQTKLEAAVPGG